MDFETSKIECEKWKKKQGYVKIHDCFPHFFLLHSKKSINDRLLPSRESVSSRCIYLCHLLRTKDYAEAQNKLIDGEWFYCLKKVVSEKWGISEEQLTKFDKHFVELDILKIKKVRNGSSGVLNYFSINYNELNQIFDQYVSRDNY